MQELISFTTLRSPDYLSLKEIDKAGIHTHKSNSQSERYRDWLSLCDNKEYHALQAEMKNFLNGELAIKKLEQVPSNIRPIIRFAEYNGFSGFDIKEFYDQLDLEKIKNHDDEEDNCDKEKSPFARTLSNFSDQLLASTQFNFNIKRDFDLQGAIKTLNLAEVIYSVGIEKIRLNIDKHYSKPLIIDSCILKVDPCSLLPVKPRPVSDKLDEQKVVTDDDGQENECRCKEEDNSDCECKCNDECVEQNPCCAEIKPYIAELFVVKDEVCKYEAGEISYIKNIIKGENQERVHRDLSKEISYSETKEEVKKFEEKFLKVTDKSNVKKTISDIIKDETKVHAGAYYGKGTKEKPKGLFAEGTFDFKRNRDRTNKIIQDKTKDIIDQLTSRLEENITTTNRLTSEREVEITNTSTLEAKNADVSRAFHNVKEIRRAQVYSYGMRTMLDFYIPEPSELLKRLVEKQFDRRKPKKPCVNIEEIGTTEADWLEYIQCYGFVDLEKPPTSKKSEYRYITVNRKSQESKFLVQPGYTATKIEYYGGHANRRGANLNAWIQVTFGSTTIKREWKDENTTSPKNINYTGEVRVLMNEDNCNDNASLTVRITLTPDPVDYIPWQLDVHRLLMEKYQNELSEYEKALAEFEKQKENYFNKNPFILNEMMQMQLKHAAISYITCQFFDENDALKGKVKDCGFPQMDLPETKREGEFVRFFEQAFEWQFMNYMLYPYFWARKCSWGDKLQEETSNYLFTRFLQSGFARVTISVRPEFEDMVNYYLQTRQIWNGGEPPIIGIGFVPIHQEIKESKNNYNADRKGCLKWDTSLNRDEILLYDNLDYYTEDFDSLGNSLGTYSFDVDEAKKDINREVNINCVTYRIVAIEESDPTNDIVKLTLDRELEIDCCCSGEGKDFDEIYDEKKLPWSTGALFIGAPWKYEVPTSLVWLREEGRCLPCYPINCEE